jgi:hypothetical protein
MTDDLDLVTAHCTSQRKTCLQTKLCCELSNLYPSGEEVSQLSDTICQFVTAARAFVSLLYSCQLPSADKARFGRQKLMESVPVIAGRPYYRGYQGNSQGEKRRQSKDFSLVDFLNQGRPYYTWC